VKSFSRSIRVSTPTCRPRCDLDVHRNDGRESRPENLFDPICEAYHVCLADAAGWTDVKSRVAVMKRCKEWAVRLAQAPGQMGPAKLRIVRFGLNKVYRRSAIATAPGLETGSGKNLADKKQKIHHLDFVQAYLRQFGTRLPNGKWDVWKCEANALNTPATLFSYVTSQFAALHSCAGARGVSGGCDVRIIDYRLPFFRDKSTPWTTGSRHGGRKCANISLTCE